MVTSVLKFDSTISEVNCNISDTKCFLADQNLFCEWQHFFDLYALLILITKRNRAGECCPL